MPPAQRTPAHARCGRHPAVSGGAGRAVPRRPGAATRSPTGSNARNGPILLYPIGSFPHILVRVRLHARGHPGPQQRPEWTSGRSASRPAAATCTLLTINALDTTQQRRCDDVAEHPEDRPDGARPAPVLDDRRRRREGPDLHPVGHPRQRDRGRRRDVRPVEGLATTPYGKDPEVDAILDHVVLLWNVDQNPDGRIANQRPNGNKLRPEPRLPDAVAAGDQGLGLDHAGVAAARHARPARIRDADPDRVDDEAPTTPASTTTSGSSGTRHGSMPNEAAMAAVGLDVDAADPRLVRRRRRAAAPSGICDSGNPPGPDEAEGWDDWGPFYTPMYSQLVGLNGSTVEMCNSTSSAFPCPWPGHDPPPRSVAGSGEARPVHDRLVNAPVRPREPPRPALGQSRRIAWRHERAATGVLPGPVRDRRHLDDASIRRPT